MPPSTKVSLPASTRICCSIGALMQVKIRDAGQADAAGILAIHNYAVRETAAVWSDAASDLASRLAWLADRTERGYPVLVAETAGRVVGYASFGDFRPWAGYRHTVENSIYLDPAVHRQGIGRALMETLIERGLSLNKHVMVAGIEATNTPSIRLHLSVGFREVGWMPQVGCKFGRWLDLVFMQRTLMDEVAP
jgi:L-amino acid N-acyltransferase